MKNITIQEGGVPKPLSVKSLVTPLTDGGTQSWVPEDETQLQQKTATRNGRIKPDSGFYGLSAVDVMVEGSYPSPGDSTPIKPSENEQMENGTVFMVAIASCGEIGFVPIITIGNAEREGVISVVDFSNAKIECVKSDGILNIDSSNGLKYANFILPNGSSANYNNKEVTSVKTNTTITYIYYGIFSAGGTEFFVGYNKGWRVSNISFSTGDPYCFAITVHTDNAAT